MYVCCTRVTTYNTNKGSTCSIRISRHTMPAHVTTPVSASCYTTLYKDVTTMHYTYMVTCVPFLHKGCILSLLVYSQKGKVRYAHDAVHVHKLFCNELHVYMSGYVTHGFIKYLLTAVYNNTICSTFPR